MKIIHRQLFYIRKLSKWKGDNILAKVAFMLADSFLFFGFIKIENSFGFFLSKNLKSKTEVLNPVVQEHPTFHIEWEAPHPALSAVIVSIEHPNTCLRYPFLHIFLLFKFMLKVYYSICFLNIL